MRGELAAADIAPAHRAWMSDSYDACVATGDYYFGLLLEHLRQLGLEEKTLVVFTSDHGEELLDHGMLAHGHSIQRELVRVPLILRGPGLPLFSTEKGRWNGRKQVGIYGLRSRGYSLHFAPDLVQKAGEPGSDRFLRLFDLDRDPLEQVDVSDELPEMAATLRSALETRLSELERAGRSIAAPSSSGEATERMLEALGYADGEAHER
jgi:arylsulfatase A-like enzyme